MKSTLRFKKEDVARVLAQLEPTDAIMLGGDQGVYLMSFATPPEGRVIAYALGTNPDIDEDWYETKRELFGGDDGGDEIGTAKALSQFVALAKKYVIIKLTETQIEVTHD